MQPKRERPKTPSTEVKNSYFTGPKDGLHFVASGCTVLDCALGGGWATGRIVNIIGDKSTAKTGLATEALINFTRQYPAGTAAYRDVEAAFEKGYAEAMCLPLDKIDFGDESNPITTVEQFARDYSKFLDQQIAAKKPGIYVLDSLDALSDEAEMERDFGEGTYGTAKAKATSELFRKLARKTEQSQVLLMVISQVREAIGVTFGEKYKRSGGKALDFYSSQTIMLSHIHTIKRTINKVERPIGIDVRAKVRKNKVGLPFRECEFSFFFGYGVSDVDASVNWLDEVGRLKELGPNDAKTVLKNTNALGDQDYQASQQDLAKLVKRVWAEVEQGFIPTRRKYL